MSELYIAGAAFVLFSALFSFFVLTVTVPSFFILLFSHWSERGRLLLVQLFGSAYRVMIPMILFLSASVLVALIYALPMLYRVNDFVQGVS